MNNLDDECKIFNYVKNSFENITKIQDQNQAKPLKTNHCKMKMNVPMVGIIILQYIYNFFMLQINLLKRKSERKK
jgi:hypothetical protein